MNKPSIVVACILATATTAHDASACKADADRRAVRPRPQQARPDGGPPRSHRTELGENDSGVQNLHRSHVPHA